jgi:putative inorganic carbon (hco3(-)) transporter
MREFLLLSIVVALAAIAVVRPKIGVYAIVWFSLMRPDVWAWSTTDHPYASILEIGTAIGSLKYLGQSAAVLRSPIFRMLLVLLVPILLSVVFAIHPSLCYEPLRWYTGCVVSSILIVLLIQTEEDFRRLLVIAALSIGYLGARFGLYGLIHGGVRFSGGYGDFLYDNNNLALALVMGVPLGWYARHLIRNKWVRLSLVVSVFLTIGAVIFTYSRGGAVALGAVFLVILLHSQRRLPLLVGLAILTVPSLYLVRDSYFDRLGTLRSTEGGTRERSVQDRVDTANMAYRMWQDYPLIGVGFGTNNQRVLYSSYVDTSSTGTFALVIHNTYLQMLVDSGTFALLAYLALLGGTILMMEFSYRRLKRVGSPLYACPLAIEAGLVGFAVGSTFLTRITFDFTYYLLMMGAAWLIVEPQHLASLAEEREEAGEGSVDDELVEAGV